MIKYFFILVIFTSSLLANEPEPNLLGVDSDNDGVSDEAEKFILKHFPDEPGKDRTEIRELYYRQTRARKKMLTSKWESKEYLEGRKENFYVACMLAKGNTKDKVELALIEASCKKGP